jgi:hypothetical protein
MYFFVRYTGFVMVAFGVLFMLAGLSGTIYGFVQHQALLALVNDSLEASHALWRLQDVRFFTSIGGLILFVTGMMTAATGQLLLIFADIANHTRETNILLRSMRRRPASQPRPVTTQYHDTDQPVG